ncbi:patatin-like protein [Nocardia sp. CA-151230]|uniref:patatin-like protein n=1 Tax=Nocardia sp. CA-151230 TaxID=3239982 RepID=UPI003D90DE46
MSRDAEPAELRIALVCYGGVSLAIYMHGITKELHKLVRASRALDQILESDSQVVNPFVGADGQPSDTESVYFDVLSQMRAKGQPLSVGIDIIAGTSAGGINGVVLGKAIAQNADQGPLKRLWIDEADLGILARGLPIGGPKLRTALAFIGKLATFWTDHAVLNGGVMSRLLYQALAGMDEKRPVAWSANARGPAPETLISRTGELSLFVTTTDLNGFDVAVASSDGGVGQRDREHAQVLEFLRDDNNKEAFGPRATPTLSFAARATSAFPGAFEPVNPGTFPAQAQFPADARVNTDLFHYSYQEDGRNADAAWFVDGGVLDNAPFDLVVDAISRRRSSTEVHRRLVYIEPDPGCALSAPPADTNSGKAAKRSWAADVQKVLVGIRGSRSLIRDLIRLRDMNEKITEMGAIAMRQEVEVLDRISAAVASIPGYEHAVPQVNSQDLGTAIDAMPSLGFLKDQKKFQVVSDNMHAEALTALGSTWNTYQRLKVEAAARCIADAIVQHFTLPGESGTAVFIRSAMAAWLRRQPCWSADDSAELSTLLQAIDTPYRQRRIMFILAGLNKLYSAEGGPPRADINDLKGQAWSQLDEITAAPVAAIRTLADKGLLDFLRPQRLQANLFEGERFRTPEDFARCEENAKSFTDLKTAYAEQIRERLGNGGQALWDAFAATTQKWNKRDRILLVSRYLGFPLWDGLLFPTISLSYLPQFTPIPMTQFSPLRATALQPLGAGKLKGVELHHFGAFAHAPDRENDYLWGRLDAAELILRTLDETFPDGTPLGRTLLPQALSAVLTTEDDLRRIPAQLIESLRAQIQVLAAEIAEGGDAARWQ